MEGRNNDRGNGGRNDGRGGSSGGRFNSGGNRGGGRFENRSNNGRGNFNDKPQPKHKATCTACKKECEVPFKPTEGRDVFCRDCFAKRN